MPTVVQTANLEAKLRVIGEVLKRPMRDVVELGGHIAAIECARTSQPFGTGRDAQEAGEKAVARDIAKVYKTTGAVWEDITDPGAKARYWRAIKASDYEHAQLIQNAYSSKYSGVPLSRFDGGAAHKANRSKTRSGGLVHLGRPVMIVTNGEALKRYVAHVQGNVGFGKGAWADAARQAGSGSIRGLRAEGDITANWITRKGHGFGKAHRGGSDENPNILMDSAVPYADQILNGSALTKAKKIAHDKMVSNLRHVVDAEMKKLRRAA